MTKTNKLMILAAAAMLVPSLALASVSVGDMLGKTKGDIRAKLEAAGYVVNEIERDDDGIEVKASLNGRRVEIEIAPDTGAIVEMEAKGGNDINDDGKS